MKDRDILCGWCGKKYRWDWCQDVIIGIDPKHYVNGSDTDLWLYDCTCGGSLAVVTEETNGSMLFLAEDSDA